ncbi:MAG TPA: hypothetical protein VEH48_00005, partial [Candidatus Nitrosopolaris sp.]|nr:hypothetical protein [Candidatus Nitrosopolaris sp.]
QYAPLSVWQQVASVFSATEGAFDNVPIENLKAAQDAMLADIEQNHEPVITELSKGDKPSEASKKAILAAAAKIAKQYRKVELKDEAES